MSSKLLKSFIGGLTGAVLSTQVSATEAPAYVCKEPSSQSLSEQWKKSKYRSVLQDNSSTSYKASKDRIARGKTYAAFTDSFWSEMEKQAQKSRLQSVGDMLDTVQASYVKAYEEKAKAVLAKGATPILEIYAYP
ncbi:MAG: hypothetical protein DI626_03545, partial [Micavibrio aeruginosavorus]